MRRHRAFVIAAALASGLTLSGCESFDLADKLGGMDLFGSGKTPLAGERKPVFPQGVPGVAQGVPPELMKGNQQAAAAEAPAPEPAAEEPKPKPKPKKASAPRQAKATPRQAPQQPQQSQQPSGAWPASPPPQQQQQQTNAPWPAPPQQQQSTAWPSNPPPQQSAWPAIPGSQPTGPSQQQQIPQQR